MLRADLSQRSVSPDNRSRSGGVGAKSIYGAVRASGSVSAAPGAVRFRSTSRALPVAMPASDVRCLVSRADGTMGAGLIDAGDSRRSLLVVTGGRNGGLQIRSALTGAVDCLRTGTGSSGTVQSGSGGGTVVSSVDGNDEIGMRVGTVVTALCLGPSNKLWCGYNDGAMRLYGLDNRASLLGDDGGGVSGNAGVGSSGRRASSPGVANSIVSGGRNSDGGGGRTLSFVHSTRGRESAASSGGTRATATALQLRGGAPPQPPDEVGILCEARKHAAAITAIVRTDACVFSSGMDWQVIRWALYAPYGSEGCVGSHSLGVRCLLVTPRFLVSGGDDTDVKLWPFQPLDKHSALSGHSSAVTTLCFHQGLLWSGAEDGTIRLWSIDGARRCVQVLTPHTAHVTTITPLDNTVYTCDKAGNILVWDATNAPLLTQRTTHAEQFCDEEEGEEADGPQGFGRGAGGSDDTVGVELLHCFRAPLPKPVKAAQLIPSVAQRSAVASATTPRGRLGKPTSPTSSTAKVTASTNLPYIHDVKLVANIKGIVAWLVTTEGCKMAFLPHRPIEEELERKLGPMAGLEGDSDGDGDRDGPRGSGVFTKDEIVAMQRQLEALEEREAEQHERLQEYQAQLEDFAAFTNVVVEDMLVQSLDLYEEHQVRVDKIMSQSRVALGDRVEKDFSKAMERIAQLEATVADREAKVQEKSKLLSAVNTKHATQMSARTDENARLSAELSKCQQDLRQSQFDLRHSKDALALAEATIKRQEGKMDKAQVEAKEITLLKMELKRTKEQLESFQSTADKHVQSAKQRSQTVAQRLHEDMEKDLSAVEAERDDAVAALQDAHTKLNKLTLEVLALQGENSGLQTEIATLKQSLDRRSVSRARSETALADGKQSSAAQLGTDALDAIGGGIFRAIAEWRSERELPAISLQGIIDANERVDGTGQSTEHLDRLRVECWPTLVEMYSEAKQGCDELESNLASSTARVESLLKECSEKSLEVERHRQQMADERGKIAKLQESVELLKKRASAPATVTNTTTTSAPSEQRPAATAAAVAVAPAACAPSVVEKSADIASATVKPKNPTLEELAGGQDVSLETHDENATLAEPRPNQQQSQQQQFFVSQPTRSIFASRGVGGANATDGPASGRGGVSVDELRSLDPESPLFEKLLTRITAGGGSGEVDDDGNEDGERAGGSSGRSSSSSPAAARDDSSVDDLGHLVRRIEKSKKQLLRLEKAASATGATHPALRKGLMMEIGRLHQQLVGDVTATRNGQTVDGFTSEMEAGLSSIVRVAQQQHNVEQQQQQQLLSIIWSQQQQLIAQQRKQQQQNQKSPPQQPLRGGRSREVSKERRDHSSPLTYAEQAARRAHLKTGATPRTATEEPHDNWSSHPRKHQTGGTSASKGLQPMALVFHPPSPRDETAAATIITTPRRRQPREASQYQLLDLMNVARRDGSPSPRRFEGESAPKPLIHATKDTIVQFEMRSRSRTP